MMTRDLWLKTDAGRMAARMLFSLAPKPNNSDPSDVQNDLLHIRWVLKVMASCGARKHSRENL